MITVVDLAAYLQQGFPDGDASAQAAVDAAVATVRGWCRRPLTLVEGATFECAGAARIELPVTPVRAVSSVLVDDVETLADWEARPDGAIAWIGSTAPPASTAAVAITYDHGYDEDDYRLAAARTVAIRLAARAYQNPLDRGAFTGPEGMGYSPAPGVAARLLTPDEREALAPLRDPRGFA